MKILICGLGAIGSNLIDQLITIAPQNEYYGIDYDRVEDRNTITQIYNNAQIGMPKVKAIMTSLHLKHRKFSYKPFDKKLSEPKDLLNIMNAINFDVDQDLIIDCFDNIEARAIVRNGTLATNIFHIGFSPKLHAEMYWNEKYIIPIKEDDSDDICENPLAKPFILLTVSFASMVVQEFLSRKDKFNYIIYNRYNIQKV